MSRYGDDLLAAALSDLDERHLRRRRRAVRVVDATHVEIDGKRYVNFASNGYLGLSHHPKVIAAARGAVEAYGVGSGAAPLVTGYTVAHEEAERAVAGWKGTEDAVLLPSGYQANHAAVGAVAGVAAARGVGVRFLLDKLVHASLIDAVRGTGVEFRVFPHNGVGKLQRLLEDAPDDGAIQVVVTESIFSMDGDAADLAAIVELKRRRPFVLLVDEAHGSGVYGPAGGGYAAELGVSGAVDLTIVTLSKALGGVGAAVCASRAWCEAVVNFGRAYLFSTSLPPTVCAAAGAAIGVLRDEPERRARVRSLAVRVREELSSGGLSVPGGDSPIVPVILGDETAAMEASGRLMETGLLVPAIRPPTVARGTSRLRVTLSCEHSDAEVERLIEALRSSVW